MQIPLHVPQGVQKSWRVEHFEVSASAAKMFNIRASFNSKDKSRYITHGKYTRLMNGPNVVMSNTPSEIADHVHFFKIAEGNVLVNGLGLGMVIEAIASKVKSLTIIEKNEEVIKLVAPTYASVPNVSILHADAFEFKPEVGYKYDYVWHDIWTDICADNLKDMTKLHRKYGKKTHWQGSWRRKECESLRKSERGEKVW